MDFRITASDIRFRIDKLFREAGITIAFPQRDVHLDTAAPVRVELVDQAGKESERDESDTSEGARPRRQG